MHYRKDRKVLRRVDYGAAKNSLMVVLAALVVYAVVAIWDNVYRVYELETMLAGGAVVAVTALRLGLVARFDTLYGAGPARWRRLFGSVLLLHAFIWGLIPAWLVWHLGVDFNFLIVLLYNVGVATAMGSAWMAGLRLRWAYVLLMFVPVIGTLWFDGAVEEWVLGFLVAAYTVYLLYLFKRQYDLFWHALGRQRRLRQAPDGEPPINVDTQLSLVYRLANELRTPMNSMMGMMSLLEDTRLSDEQSEYLQVTGRSGRLMLSLIDDVLDYSRILSGRITLSPDYFNLRIALEQTLEVFGPIAQQKGLELSVVVDRMLPLRVRGDRDRLLQVLTNLLSNAIKFTERGEIRVDVDFTSEGESHGILRIVVHDQGAGMDPDTLQHLFRDRYLGGERDAFEIVQHSGFGLLVCKGLMDAMGGTIDAESVQGRGSTVWFSVPLGMQADMTETNKLANVMSWTGGLLVGAAAGGRACLIEEFEALGGDCRVAHNYQDVVSALRARVAEGREPGLLLVDTHEDRQQAIHLCREVLQESDLRSAKLLLLCTIEERAEPGIQKLVDRHGLVAVVRPVQRRALRVALSRALEVPRLVPFKDLPTETPEERQRRKHYRLLLVEDNEADTQVACGMLAKLGYQVKSTAGAEDGLALLEEQRFDLVLMGRAVAESDNLAATSRLRERERERSLPRIPVVVLTSDTADGEQARCLAAGVDDVLTKPVSVQDLETMLRYWLPEQPGNDSAGAGPVRAPADHDHKER